jgi:hypothetical protein
MSARPKLGRPFRIDPGAASPDPASSIARLVSVEGEAHEDGLNERRHDASPLSQALGLCARPVPIGLVRKVAGTYTTTDESSRARLRRRANAAEIKFAIDE